MGREQRERVSRFPEEGCGDHTIDQAPPPMGPFISSSSVTRAVWARTATLLASGQAVEGGPGAQHMQFCPGRAVWEVRSGLSLSCWPSFPLYHLLHHGLLVVGVVNPVDQAPAWSFINVEMFSVKPNIPTPTWNTEVTMLGPLGAPRAMRQSLKVRRNGVGACEHWEWVGAGYADERFQKLRGAGTMTEQTFAEYSLGTHPRGCVQSFL